MADHTPGDMDTTAHERTFAGFTRMVARAAIIILILLVLLALVNG